MNRTRSARALAGGLIVISVLAFATAAYAATVRTYSGKTSQHQSISFQTARGYLTHVQFYINDKCPSGHLWRIHDFNFPKIRVSDGHFSQKFKAKTGSAFAQIKGTVATRQAWGTISERRLIPQEHHICSGSAKFTIKRS
jgi:hypothetical protein